MSTKIKLIEEELMETFSDTLNKGTSLSAIIIRYNDGKENRVEIGVPYSINNNILEIGPYFKNSSTSTPNDYHERKKEILISNIIEYRKIALSDIV